MIKIGTRGSRLALWQAHYVADLLKKEGIESEIVVIETKGDKILNKSLSKIGSKGIFTAELEEQLFKKKIDIAVHSAKDVQSELPKGLQIIAYTEREQPHDVLISYNKNSKLVDFDKSFVVGTSSTRRISLLKHFYPHIRTAESRGNLQTRLKKLEEGYYDALILAYAGVLRMDYHDLIVESLPVDSFTPAVGQGTIAVEAAETLSENKKQTIRRLVNHALTEQCMLIERAYLRALQGGCSVPVFGLATWQNGLIEMNAGIVSLDGQTLLRRQQLMASKDDLEKTGEAIALQLLNDGADKILQQVKKGQ